MELKLQVGVKIFLKNKNGKYLLVKRSPEKYKNVKGDWDIVGGRIETGSTLIENLKREIKEETGLELKSEPVLLCAQDIFYGGEKHVVRLSYKGETDGEPVLDTNENIDYKWLSFDELKNQENLDFYVKEIIDKGIISD